MEDLIKHIVCYSGGHSSALVAIEVVRKYGKDNVILLNHDINPNVENEDIKRFKREVADYLGLNIMFANYDNETPENIPDQFDVVQKIGYFTDRNRNVLCTYELKTKPFHAYLDENFEDKNCVIYYGFDANETKRILRRSSILASQGFKTAFPLAHWKRTIQSTLEIGITPPQSYASFKHANCTGCLKAGAQHWYIVYCERPDIWEKAKETEEKIEYSIIKGTFLEELEPKFELMKKLGVKPTEHVQFQTFWADVRKLLKEQTPDAANEEKPCECVF